MKFRASIITVLLAFAPAAHAEWITWRVLGTITNSLAYPPGSGGLNGPGVIVAALTFDTEAVDNNPDSALGEFGSLVTVSFSIYSEPRADIWPGMLSFDRVFTVDPTLSSITVMNNAAGPGGFSDGIRFVAVDSQKYGGDGPSADSALNELTLDLRLESLSPSGLLLSDSIFGIPPDLELFNVREIQVGGYYSLSNEYWFSGSADAFVPIPAAAWLLLSGLGALGAVRWRPRKPLV